MERKWLIAIPILLVLLVLCAGMIAIGVATASRVNLEGVPVLPFVQAKANAEAEEQQAFSVQTPAELLVNSPCGGVDVAPAKPGDSQEISVTAHKKAWGKDTEQAQANLGQIKLNISQEGDRVQVGLADPTESCLIGNLPYQVSYVIHVPAKTAVQVSTQNGNISLDGIERKADLASRFGDVTVSQVNASLAVNTTNGKITARQIQAGEDPIQLKTQFGEVQLEQANGGQLKVETSNGSVRLDTVVISETVTLSSDFGDIAWEKGQGRSLEVRSKNGRITLQDLTLAGAVTASSDFGDVHLDRVQAETYSATTKNGRISLTGVMGMVTARSDFGDIDLQGDGRLDFDLNSDNGSITVQGELGDGDHLIRTRFGNIQVGLPEKSTFNFDLQTRFGKISSDFPVTIQGTPSETHWQGTVNGGGPGLTASTQNGNIELQYNQ